MKINEAIETLVHGDSLDKETSADVMRQIMEGQISSAQIASFLTALRIKGETAEEIAGMAIAMRDNSLRVSVQGNLVDTAGTGGDGSGSFNISTAAAFVAAAAGIKIAKHGNRAASGKCGSADLLEAIGSNIELSPSSVEQCINDVNFGFMFAPLFHPAMKHAAPVRRELGIRTVFNVLGPLTNPAKSRFQLLGVADKSLGGKMTEVLHLMGSTHSMVVHGEDGLDEMTLGGITHIWELKNGEIKYYTISPEEMNLEYVSKNAVRGGDAAHNAYLFKRVLSGDRGPFLDFVALNSAAVLYLGGRVDSLGDGVKLAFEILRNKTGLEKAREYVALSKSLT